MCVDAAAVWSQLVLVGSHAPADLEGWGYQISFLSSGTLCLLASQVDRFAEAREDDD